jgi:2-oxoisovalerate dehydrogenase E2 component (dihydrolipoyl transacylase)
LSAVIRDFALPDLGEGLTESELVAWRVAVGERVELNQIIADVETAKAVVELPSPFAGVVTALHAEPGQTVNVGERLFSCDTGADASGGDPSGADASGTNASGAEVAADGEAHEPTLVGYGAVAERGPRRRTRRVALAADLVPAPAAAEDATTTFAESHDTASNVAGTADALGVATVSGGPARADRDASPERPRSTPPVRKLARDLGVELDEIVGTGERGLITRRDVEAAATAPLVGHPTDDRVERRGTGGAGGTAGTGIAGGARPTAADVPSETRIPVQGVRKATAAAMVRSAFTAPHVSEFLTVDVTATMDLVRSIRADRGLERHRVTPLAVVAKAVCLAARRTPEVNSRWDEAAGEIVRYDGLNLGIAVATERGLMVPNVRRADRMTLLELADAIGVLAETARAGRIAPSDLSGGTLSITNIGVFGVDAGTPILNPGEAAILATGAVRRQPWEYRGEIALREIMTLSLSFDHRLVDGEQGSRFLVDVGTILREPGRALLMS